MKKPIKKFIVVIKENRKPEKATITPCPTLYADGVEPLITAHSILIINKNKYDYFYESFRFI